MRKMEILLRGVGKKGEAVKRDLETAFANPPQVTIEDGPQTGGTVQAVVTYPPSDTRDRKSVTSVIDAVIMRNGFVFCGVDHRDKEKEVAGGWPTL
jgi:hypothetical protein